MDWQHLPLSQNPINAVGGLFKSSLQTKAARLLLESHPRKWVDRSSPAYKTKAARCFPNPTHGSGWIVQVQPTKRGDSHSLFCNAHSRCEGREGSKKRIPGRSFVGWT